MKLRYVVAGCAAVILVPIATAYLVLRASLPQLDGDLHRLGLVAAVTIDRDALGVPTIEAANRVDLAFATGFVHGQDRFFQMDVSRRFAAGELSEVFGSVALEQDKKARLFRFRQIAQQILQQASAEQRAVLEAYARGVNAGLASLRSRPWEYWLLRSVPAEWRPEDTSLVTFSMWWDLQYGSLEREILRKQINERMRGPECAGGWKCSLKFLYPLGTEWDAPNAPVGVVNSGPVGGAGTVALNPIPSPDILDVRGGSVPARSPAAFIPSDLQHAERDIGSNNWAVAGRLTTTGAALVANDMHLTARVPAIWYRARLRIKGKDAQPALDLNGVTLAGAPLIVAGSNGHIAWGFTDSYGNWFHVERSACAAATSVQHEEIRIHGQPSVDFAVRSAPAGVLFQAEPDNQSCWFVTWLAQDPSATNLDLMDLERAASVEQALQVAPRMGIPHENLIVGDREGHIAWTIAGRIPVDTGAGRAIGNSSTWTTPQNHPRIVDPEVGRLWTANARPTDDPAQEAAIGGIDAANGAHYDLSGRAHQIREDLLAIKGPATEDEMLRIQLDDRAEFLTRWRAMLLDLLDTNALANHPERAAYKQLVSDWNARASIDSVGYRLVRTFHEQTETAVWEMVLGALGLEAHVWAPSQFEGALWRLVNERPMHMLASSYADWRQFLLAQVDASLADLHQSCPQLERCTWGSREPVRIRHPLSRALPPFLSRLLDMPTVELPGDHDMPRVQDGVIGASERFAVSPGHEDQGYIHIPGGQSGHPLSPYYRAGFRDWAKGVPAPFLPGASQHRLTLESD
jgi:penicillin G amidase